MPYLKNLASSGATEDFGNWASEIEFGQIPTEIVENAKLSVLDALGCGLFGSVQPWGQIAADVAAAQSPGGSTTIWGRRVQAGVADAAFANGTAVHGFELDDVHQLSLMHPGSVTVPAALAMAEKNGVSGRTFLLAVVAGYEVGLRVGSLTSIPHMLRGYHPTGTVGSICASVASGKVLDLQPQAMRNAVAIGATQAAGLYCASKTGAMVKRMHAGRAAQSGVLAALLAERGFTGSVHALEDENGGFMATLASGEDLTVRIADLGHDWETSRVGFKAYAACASAHTIIDALDQMMREGLRADQLDTLTIRLSRIGMNNVGWPYQPAGVVSAQMNAQYTAAVKLLDGEVFVDQFREGRLEDPRTLEMIRRIHVVHDASIDEQGSHARHATRVSAHLIDGSTKDAYVEQRRGSSAHPMKRQEIVEKFRKLASKVLEPEIVETLEATVLVLESVPDMRSVAHLLTTSAAARG